MEASGHSTESPSNGVHTVYVSDQSREIGFATPETIAEALTYLHRDGVLVLGNAIEVEHLDRLREQLQPEAEEIAKNPTHHFNFGRHTRNMDQAPPTMVDLMFEDVWAKRIAVSILQSLLGPNLMCHYANGNTALKAEGRQPVHSDIDKPHPLYPFAYAINIPLSDMNVENGSTELWPGSHRESKIDQHVTVTNEEYGLAIKPALAPSKVTLPLKSKALVDSWKANSGLEYEAHWVDGDVDHRKVNSDDVDFSTGNSKLLELEPLMYPAPRSTSSL
ncbi:hypothetical protein D0868_04265 [Hortaea werneckii]|uniref:Uncharacterized protein n=1 Tax=Hortaea werneckii TaxID=91943 RepID=A0A3M6Z236_HORWE|nr:hypothetical protein D0868_04265 [Hortaea werneckii]